MAYAGTDRFRNLLRRFSATSTWSRSTIASLAGWGRESSEAVAGATFAGNQEAGDRAALTLYRWTPGRPDYYRWTMNLSRNEAEDDWLPAAAASLTFASSLYKYTPLASA